MTSADASPETKQKPAADESDAAFLQQWMSCPITKVFVVCCAVPVDPEVVSALPCSRLSQSVVHSSASETILVEFAAIRRLCCSNKFEAVVVNSAAPQQCLLPSSLVLLWITLFRQAFPCNLTEKESVRAVMCYLRPTASLTVSNTLHPM